MPIFRGLSKSAVARLQQMDKLLRNIQISGPDVSAQVAADSLTLRVNRPPASVTKSAPPPGTWIKVTTQMPLVSGTGGGAFYNGRTIKGSPGTTDPSTDLSIPQTGETVTGTDDILVENTAESGLGEPPSHWIPNGTILFAIPAGKSNETPSRPVYRVSFPRPLPTGTGLYKVLMLIDALNPGTPGWDFPRFY